MNILLVKPYNLSDHIQPALGLGYLASSVRSSNRVKILDCIKENIKITKLARAIKEFRPDVIGFQCYTLDLAFVKQALAIVKETDKKIITIVGGPHPSALPEATFEHIGNNLDYALRGECEKSFPLFIEYVKDKERIIPAEIPGLTWRENGEIRTSEPYFENDLDSLGIPSWDLIRPETYPESQHGAFYKKFPIAPIMLTRGCPYQCTFCAGKIVSGKKLRKRSIRGVINEIQLLYKDYGIREFHIIDDNFIFDGDYAKSFLKSLIALNFEISLAMPNGIRMEAIDEELLSLMKKSGVYLISLGIESGSDRILKLMKKNLKVEKTKEIARFIRKHDLEIAGFFILGFPGETKEDIMNTIRLSLELDLIRANFFTYLPFPGTESYYLLRKSNELKEVDWDRFYFMNAAYAPKGMTRRELKWLQRIAFAKFYLRPKILWKNIKAIKSFKHFYFLFKRFFHWIIMS